MQWISSTWNWRTGCFLSSQQSLNSQCNAKMHLQTLLCLIKGCCAVRVSWLLQSLCSGHCCLRLVRLVTSMVHFQGNFLKGTALQGKALGLSEVCLQGCFLTVHCVTSQEFSVAVRCKLNPVASNQQPNPSIRTCSFWTLVCAVLAAFAITRPQLKSWSLLLACPQYIQGIYLANSLCSPAVIATTLHMRTSLLPRCRSYAAWSSNWMKEVESFELSFWLN